MRHAGGGPARNGTQQVVFRPHVAGGAQAAFAEGAGLSVDFTNVLGTGSFGQVLRGQEGGTAVAVKLAHPGRERWVAVEAGFLCRLAHTNIVGYRGLVSCGSPQGTQREGLVLELCKGGSLEAWLAGHRSLGPPTLQQRLLLAQQLLGALDHIHSAGFCHLDVKPGNVLLAGDEPPGLALPQLKLTDFGLSFNLNSGCFQGRGRGTLPYMAPELVRHATAEARTALDIWSLGVVLRQLFLLTPPCEGWRGEDVTAGLCSAALYADKIGCEPEWQLLLDMCLQYDPHKRASIAQLQAAVATLLEHGTVKLCPAAAHATSPSDRSCRAAVAESAPAAAGPATPPAVCLQAASPVLNLPESLGLSTIFERADVSMALSPAPPASATRTVCSTSSAGTMAAGPSSCHTSTASAVTAASHSSCATACTGGVAEQRAVQAAPSQPPERRSGPSAAALAVSGLQTIRALVVNDILARLPDSLGIEEVADVTVITPAVNVAAALLPLELMAQLPGAERLERAAEAIPAALPESLGIEEVAEVKLATPHSDRTSVLPFGPGSQAEPRAHTLEDVLALLPDSLGIEEVAHVHVTTPRRTHALTVPVARRGCLPDALCIDEISDVTMTTPRFEPIGVVRSSAAQTSFGHGAHHLLRLLPDSLEL